MAATNSFFQLPRSKQNYLNTQLGNATGDIAVVSNIITELVRCCERTTHYTPRLDFDVELLGDRAARVTINAVPAMSHSTACSIVATAASAIYRVRFVFRDELTQQQLHTGRVEIEFWRASIDDRERHVYTPPKRGKTRARDVEIDYDGLNTTADDRSNIERLMDYVHHMAPVMPRIGVSCELLVRDSTANEVTRVAEVPKKRTRRHEAAEDETVLTAATNSDAAEAVSDANHVGFCLFFVGVPNFDAAFLEYLKKMFGNLMLEAVVLAPVRWTDPATPDSTFDTAQELAVSLRRSTRKEADCGPYCIDGSRRLVRVLERNAKAFKGVRLDEEPNNKE